MDFAKIIKKHGGQTAVSKKTGISQPHISEICRGRWSAGAMTCIKISESLNYDIMPWDIDSNVDWKPLKRLIKHVVSTKMSKSS